MHRYALLGLLPAALGCLDPKNNPCASYMSANQATASAFCATYTQTKATASTGLPAWAANCSNKPSMISKECSCYFTGGAAAPTPTSTAKTTAKTTAQQTTAKTTTAAPIVTAAPSGVTTALPKSSGAVSSSKAITLTAGQVFDGGMKNYDRSRMGYLDSKTEERGEWKADA
jgi:hypothetical protein